MLSTTFFVQALLASVAFAVPSKKERFAARKARRSIGVSHQTTTAKFVNSSITMDTSSAVSDSPVASDNAPDSSIAGAALFSDTRYFENLIGSFTVPSAISNNREGEQCISVWIGMDGITCSNVLLQVGVDICVEDDEVGIVGWYDFWPSTNNTSAGDFNLTINPGDFIDLSLDVSVSGPYSGDVFILNHNSGTFGVSKTLSSTQALCQTNVEWIVDAFDGIPFDFGTIQWTEAEALTPSGLVTTGAGNPAIVDIGIGGVQVSQTSVSGWDITVQYIE